MPNKIVTNINSTFAIRRVSLRAAAKYHTGHVSAANHFFLVGISAPSYSETHQPCSAAYKKEGVTLPKAFTVASLLSLAKFGRKLHNLLLT